LKTIVSKIVDLWNLKKMMVKLEYSSSTFSIGNTYASDYGIIGGNEENDMITIWKSVGKSSPRK
jgi:hypothetical protein